MAIDLLRVFGGREALPELASMLDDADPQVQRESIRAIVQIGTNEAYAVLERALVAGSASRDTVLQELIGLRDDKAIPLLCYVLNHSAPRGKLVEVHTQIIEALGGLSAHQESTRTLRAVLYRGEWWAPYRTAALRRAAATALRRIGTPETLAVLEDAVAHGSRGVRSAAARADRAGRAAGAGPVMSSMPRVTAGRRAGPPPRRGASRRAALRAESSARRAQHRRPRRHAVARPRHRAVHRHRHRRRRARRRRQPGAARRREHGRADAAAAAVRHRAHRHRPRRGARRS